MSPAIYNGESSATNGHVVKKAHLDGFGTRAIHVGSEANQETGAVIPSISLSTTYKQNGIGNHKVSVKISCIFFLAFSLGCLSQLLT